MKKYAFLFLILVLFLSASAPVMAESYEIVSDWMDLFFQTERSPWTLHQKEVEQLMSPLMRYFQCRSGMSEDGDHQMKCKSIKNAGVGEYNLIFSFGSDVNLILDAVEIAANHPTLTKEWDKYKNIDREINYFTRKMKEKAYIAPGLFETPSLPSSDTLHTIMTKGVEYSQLFMFDDTAVSIGHNGGVFVLNFCSYYYYAYNNYREIKDPVTGEIQYDLVFPDLYPVTD